jgi:hypothetical protein
MPWSLARGYVQARPSAQPSVDMSGNFLAHVYVKSQKEKNLSSSTCNAHCRHSAQIDMVRAHHAQGQNKHSLGPKNTVDSGQPKGSTLFLLGPIVNKVWQ